MEADWKEKLNSLRNSLTPGNEEEEVSSVELSAANEKKTGQKDPLIIVLDKKGRNGKVATIIEGFTIPQEEVEDIARQLKNKLGTGGSVRDGEILIQGDRRQKIIEFLKNKNFKTKSI